MLRQVCTGGLHHEKPQLCRRSSAARNVRWVKTATHSHIFFLSVYKNWYCIYTSSSIPPPSLATLNNVHINYTAASLQSTHAFLFSPKMQTLTLKEIWYVGIKGGDTQHKNGPCLHTVMAIWRHPVTTHKCRTSALHWKPHLFRFAFFANIASDHLESAYILSGYNEGQFVWHSALSWISHSMYSTKDLWKSKLTMNDNHTTRWVQF